MFNSGMVYVCAIELNENRVWGGGGVNMNIKFDRGGSCVQQSE